MNAIETMIFHPWIEFLGGWLWEQSLGVFLVFLPVIFLARLKYFQDPRIQTVLWGVIFARLALPVILTVSIDGSVLEQTRLGKIGLHPIEQTLSNQPSTTSMTALTAPDLPPLMPGLIASWAFVVLLLTLYWFFARRRYSHLLRVATPVEDPRIADLAGRWCQAYAIQRTVKLVTHKTSLSPFTMGTFKPVIYIPRKVLLGSVSSLEAVLAHELAHVKSFDDLKIKLQRLVSTLFFFHPVVWWCGRKLNYHRELARDRDVLSRQLLDYRQYGNGILDAARTAVLKPVGLAALGSMFPRRISALLEANSHRQQRSPWLRAFVFLGLFSLPMVAFSGPEPPATRPTTPPSIVWRNPLPNGWISSPFGMRKNPFTGERSHHRGTDIVDREGAPILAPASGRVLLATETPENPDWGTTLILQHEQGFQTFFAHLRDLRVREGEKVEKGQVVATLGATGRVTAGHLHFEIWRGTTPVDAGDLIDALKKGQGKTNRPRSSTSSSQN